MTDQKPSRWARIGAAMTRIRLFLSNLLFFGFLLIVILLLVRGGERITVPDGGALVLNPTGAIVEQRTPINPLQQWLDPSVLSAETELWPILDALERARQDDRIRMVVLDLDGLESIATAHAQAISGALEAFRGAGKEVIAYGSAYDQQPYLMASAADAVYMHPFGQILLPGYQINTLYFKGLLDNLKVNVHVFRAGRYKEFVEPYTRSDMSPEAREVNAELIAALWGHYQQAVVERRRLDPERFERYTQFLDQALQETGGDLARLALEYHLVDELLTPDQARVRIGDKVGYDGNGDFRQIGFSDYLRIAGPAMPDPRKPQVGVITAQGPITMNGPLRGVIAADRTIELIRQAREDERIGALVVRLDTPGGSSFASELIRQELELTQLVGKPVVVSMGPVAASGGYWIASTADAIVAEPTTLTGSIGVFGIFPTLEDSLGAIGVHSDGVATSSLGSLNPLIGLGEPTVRMLQSSTEHVYARFVNLVARGRGLSAAEVDGIAEGRVWLGTAAKELGLVDLLGDRADAVAQAAALAGLTDYGVRQLEPPMTPRELLMQQLTGTGAVLGIGAHQGILGPVGEQVRDIWRLFRDLNDPLGNYALCDVCSFGRMGPYSAW